MFLLYILIVMYLSLIYIVRITSTNIFIEGILFIIVISLFIFLSLVPINTLINKTTPIFVSCLLALFLFAWLLKDVAVILFFIVSIPWLFCYIFFDIMLFVTNESTDKKRVKGFLENLFVGFLFSLVFMYFYFFMFENQFDNFITVENVLRFLVVNLFINIPHLTVLYINKVQDERKETTD